MKKHLRTLSVCLALSVCVGILPARAATGYLSPPAFSSGMMDAPISAQLRVVPIP